MFRTLLLTLPIALALTAAGPALADECYSGAQKRQMVQDGQALSLSGIIGQVKAIGQVVSPDPLLCNVGGRLVYLVDVISAGNVIHVQVDAQTGAINY